MFRLLIILMGVITIILFLFVYLCFWVYGNMKGVVLFIIFFIAIPVLLGCGVVVLLTKLIEKRTGKKLIYKTIMCYIGVSCWIFMFIAIMLFFYLM